MIGGACITDLHSGGNALGAEHGGHERGVIQTDAFPGLQDLVHLRKIPALNMFRLLPVVGDVGNDEIEDVGNGIQIAVRGIADPGAFRHGIGIRGEPAVLVRVEEGAEYIVQKDRKLRAEDFSVHGALDVAVDAEDIVSVTK